MKHVIATRLKEAEELREVLILQKEHGRQKEKEI